MESERIVIRARGLSNITPHQQAGYINAVITSLELVQVACKTGESIHKKDGYEPVLKHSRWCLLKRRENLTEKQQIKLGEIMRYHLKTVQAYIMREDFQPLWDYVSPGWAGKYRDHWCTLVMSSNIDPMEKVAKMLRTHRPLILNWFKAKKAFSSGIVEGRWLSRLLSP